MNTIQSIYSLSTGGISSSDYNVTHCSTYCNFYLRFSLFFFRIAAKANMCSGGTYPQVIHRLWITFRAGKGRIVPSNFSSRVKHTGRTCDNFMVVVLDTII